MSVPDAGSRSNDDTPAANVAAAPAVAAEGLRPAG